MEIIAGPGRGQAFTIKAGQLLEIGRSHETNISVTEDRQMSRRHFTLNYDGVDCYIQDLDSANGTFVEGKRVAARSFLRVGDRIDAGSSSFLLLKSHEVGQFPSANCSARRVVEPAPIRSGISGEWRQMNSSLANDDHVMHVDNSTPFSVATMFWEDLDAHPQMSVIVKGTFKIAANTVSPVAMVQLPIFTTDQHYGDDIVRPVRFESDMVPFKPLADIVLVGQAHAPSGRLVTMLEAGLRVGSRSSVIAVYGDRCWLPSLLGTGDPIVSSPQPFVTMALIYERAFGGIDEESSMYYPYNLAGTGFIGRNSKRSVEGKQLPNLEDSQNLIRAWNSRPKPVGFGFFGRGWMPRLAFAGTYDDKYRKERAPALPKDFSYRVFNGAHPDLQVEGYLDGNETVSLVNVAPQARLNFQLPGIRPKISVLQRISFSNASPNQVNDISDSQLVSKFSRVIEKALAVNLDTLVFIPDEGVFYEVFRAVCPLSDMNPEEICQIKISM